MSDESTSRARWQDHVREIAALVRDGAFIEPACEQLGVSVDAVRKAMSRGMPEANPIVRARAELENDLAKSYAAKAKAGDSATSTKDFLATLAPKRWHLPTKVQVSGDPDNGAAVRHEIKLTLADAIAGAKGGDE